MKKKRKYERGSITIFTVVAMMFFVTVLVLSYSRQLNKINSQKRQIQEIEKQYNVDSELEETYYRVKNKL